jgi:hypothetical protein
MTQICSKQTGFTFVDIIRIAVVWSGVLRRFPTFGTKIMDNRKGFNESVVNIGISQSDEPDMDSKCGRVSSVNSWLIPRLDSAIRTSHVEVSFVPLE